MTSPFFRRKMKELSSWFGPVIKCQAELYYSAFQMFILQILNALLPTIYTVSTVWQHGIATHDEISDILHSYSSRKHALVTETHCTSLSHYVPILPFINYVIRHYYHRCWTISSENCICYQHSEIDVIWWLYWMEFLWTFMCKTAVNSYDTHITSLDD